MANRVIDVTSVVNWVLRENGSKRPYAYPIAVTSSWCVKRWTRKSAKSRTARRVTSMCGNSKTSRRIAHVADANGDATSDLERGSG